jgi:hypothetical protein
LAVYNQLPGSILHFDVRQFGGMEGESGNTKTSSAKSSAKKDGG